MNRTSPARERARVDALRRYGILDAAPEQRFEDLVELTSATLGVPVVALTFVDNTRQWSMAAIGIERGERPRDESLAAHAILDDQPLVIEDACLDARVSGSQLVTAAPHARACAAAPLITPNGLRVGALCVLDRQPRSFDPLEVVLLVKLARQAVELLEHRLTAARLADALERLQTMASLIPICSHCRKVRDSGNHWMTLERFVQATTGSRFTHGICPDCVREHYPDAAEELLSQS